MARRYLLPCALALAAGRSRSSGHQRLLPRPESGIEYPAGAEAGRRHVLLHHWRRRFAKRRVRPALRPASLRGGGAGRGFRPDQLGRKGGDLPIPGSAAGGALLAGAPFHPQAGRLWGHVLRDDRVGHGDRPLLRGPVGRQLPGHACLQPGRRRVVQADADPDGNGVPGHRREPGGAVPHRRRPEAGRPADHPAAGARSSRCSTAITTRTPPGACCSRTPSAATWRA